MMWRPAVLHAAECAALLGQTECAGRLLAAETWLDGLVAASLTESAAQAVVAATEAMLRRYPSREVSLLGSAANDVRRAALQARIACLLADVAGER